jgi:hypothetical protein
MSIAITVVLLGLTLYTNSINARVHAQASFDYGDNDISMEKVGQAGLIIGAVGLATYGLVKFGDWLFHKSDETETEAAQKTIREATAQYTSIITILSNAYAGAIDRQSCINNIAEPVLYEIAKAKYHDADIALYVKRLAKTLKSIESHDKNLRERIRAAQSHEAQDYETLRLIARMKTVEARIQAVLPSLIFAYDYLKHHESFFRYLKLKTA